MIEALAQGQNLPEAYHKALLALWELGEVTECPDYNQKQRELSMTFQVMKPLSEPLISRLFIGGPEDLEQYRQEMLEGILDFRIGHGWDYTYHARIVEQLPFIKAELRRNPYTRRAVIDVRDWREDTIPGHDPACLQHIQFFVRNNILHMKVLMRSNDATEATYMNAFAFIQLGKHIADELGYAFGTYTHRANSFHCYEKDFKLLEGYVERIQKADKADAESLTYEYKDYWEDIMAESRPIIAEKVKTIRERMK